MESVISLFFSCDNQEKVKKDKAYVPYRLEIDSVNASDFAESFILDIYNSDTISARSKIHIAYESDSSCVSNLLAIEKVFSELDLFTQLNKRIMLGADLRLQNYRTYFKDNILWLRLFTAPQQVDYYRLNLMVENNEIVISEYRSFMRGDGCNELMEELVNSVYTKQQLNITDVSIGLNLMDSTVMAFNDLDIEETGLYYSQIDLALRETKIIAAIKYQLDFHSSSKVKLEALLSKRNEYRSTKGMFTPWMWFNYFYMKLEEGKYSEARSALPEIRLAVGNDPILIYLEATIYFEEYKYKEALQLYNEALVAERTIPNIHFAKVICLIEMKEYVQAAECLLIMEDYFEVRNTNWDKEFIAYPDFLISDEYSIWLERIGYSENQAL